MILSIPYQTFEASNIRLLPFQHDKHVKNIARLSYNDNSVDLHDISILSPPVKVIDYNTDSSRLRLDLSEQIHFQNKLNTIQEYLIRTITHLQQNLLGINNHTIESIRELFYLLLDNSVLSLYIFSSTLIKKEDGNMCKITELKAGDVIRLVIRFQGLLQVQNKYGLRLRLQHSSPSIWYLSGNS